MLVPFWVLRALVLGSLMVMMPSFIYLPRLLARFVRDSTLETVLSFANCFSAGVFLAAGILDLLNDSVHELGEALGEEIPYALIFCLCGFMLGFFLEKVLLAKDPFEELEQTARDRMHKLAEEEQHCVVVEAAAGDCAVPEPVFVSGHGPHHVHNTEEHVHLLVHPTSEVELGLMERKPLVERPPTQLEQQQKKEFDAIIAPGPNVLLAYILTAVLGTHTFISGLAMGLQTESAGLFTLWLAIFSHKWIECMALGVTFIKQAVPRHRFLSLVLVYTLILPVGFFIGVLVESVITVKAAGIVEGVLIGIASGTFLYVGVVDILVSEFSTTQHKYSRFFTVLVGLVGMGTLLVSVHSSTEE